ncbi:MAG: HyaD/HybD family hydrogenase maturation endopeptidase [Desulfobacterota bacterium]|nr:HyaD/HybD family hydrogenase maturation endopeptidase [Thermodesulfobacteriota bacterium]MDW8001434.1 HyaD/HybD family hydrogenase maturation endopeptidase [Deltaproteobacteria bacterium]
MEENSKNKASPRTVILGIGNVLLSDEGLGVYVVHELSKLNLPENVEVMDGGTLGFGLLDIVCEADRLIIVDAIKGGCEPGTVYHISLDDLQKMPRGTFCSFHEVGILDVLRAAELLGKRPKTEVFGIEPKSLELKMELSEEIRNKVPKLIDAILTSLTEEQG